MEDFPDLNSMLFIFDRTVWNPCCDLRDNKVSAYLSGHEHNLLEEECFPLGIIQVMKPAALRSVCLEQLKNRKSDHNS